MGARIRLCVMFAACVFGCGYVSGQNTVASLQQEINKAEEEIRISTRLLEKTKSDQKSNETQRKLVGSRIQNRKKLISSLEEQIALVDKDIKNRSNDIYSLEAQRDDLKSEYAKLVRESYKNYKLNNFLLFLFAAQDFNDASRRVDFMRRYNRQMELKAARIDSLSQVLTVEIGQLDARKQDISGKKEAHTKELASLAADQKQYDKLNARLAADRKKIEKDLAAKRAAIKKAQDQIARIIEEERRKANKTPKTDAQRQYDIALSGRFDQNKGKLPYPVRGGVIIDHFGVHAVPNNPNVKVDNKGVNFACERGAQVFCVFDGTVTSVSFYDFIKWIVIVTHGKYRTVYANMEKVDVKPGDKVSGNQVLGNISTGDYSDDHMLHFEIWGDGNTRVDPEHWLRR